MISQGVREVPINALLSPKEFIDLSGSGLKRWASVVKATETGVKLPPIIVTPGKSGIPIRNVVIGEP